MAKKDFDLNAYIQKKLDKVLKDKDRYIKTVKVFDDCFKKMEAEINYNLKKHGTLRGASVNFETATGDDQIFSVLYEFMQKSWLVRDRIESFLKYAKK